MKIDLLKDKGVLGAIKFVVSDSKHEKLSEDEQLVETLKRRHSHVQEDSEELLDDSNTKTIEESPGISGRNPLREALLFITMLLVTTYYLQDQGLLSSYMDLADAYWNQLTGAQVIEEKPQVDTNSDAVLSDDIFNQLMPVTADIEALADSIANIAPESLYVAPQVTDTQTVSDDEYLPIFEEPIELSDDDILIINNRSLLLMATELIENIPSDIGDAHLFMKRDGMTFSAVQGGDWVKALKSTLDKFVLGNFNENYSSGNAKISSKFEIIINAEQDFHPEILDEMRLLDVLAHPFNDYLEQIIIDLPRGLRDNPAKFTFAGTPQEIKYILSSWAETRTNILIRSIDVRFQSNQLMLSFDITFFTYTP